MDIEGIVKQVLGSESAKWSGMLTKIGFSGTQASELLSNVLEKVGNLISGGELDLNKGVDPQQIVEKLDVGALASKIGVDPDKTLQGLNAVVPDIAKTLQEKVGAEGLLSDLGGIGGAVGKLFGK